jgi:dUTP pyrophosphatase
LFKMYIKLLNEFAKVPTKADPGAAGYDIYSTESVEIEPGTRVLVSTGLSTAFEKGYLRIAPRSGMSVRGIDVGAGVIDSSYRGEIKVLLINNSKDPYFIKRGDRIAQGIFEVCYSVEFQVVETLPDSERGSGGFGSSGL